MKNGNGYATKIDLKNLEGKMDSRFEQVDKRFEQINKKLGKIDMRLGIFKIEWDGWKQDALTEFNSSWITRIDPILADIERHREQEVIWTEQNLRLEERVNSFDKKLDAIAKKIGV